MTAVQENKKKFVEGELAAMLKVAYSNAEKIKNVYYFCVEDAEYESVYIELEPYREGGEGRRIMVDITADSLSAIVNDVVRAMARYY